MSMLNFAKRFLGGFGPEGLTVGLNISNPKLQSTARLACYGEGWQKRVLGTLVVSVRKRASELITYSNIT